LDDSERLLIAAVCDSECAVVGEEGLWWRGGEESLAQGTEDVNARNVVGDEGGEAHKKGDECGEVDHCDGDGGWIWYGEVRCCCFGCESALEICCDVA
jgi:hypothetical protein